MDRQTNQIHETLLLAHVSNYMKCKNTGIKKIHQTAVYSDLVNFNSELLKYFYHISYSILFLRINIIIMQDLKNKIETYC